MKDLLSPRFKVINPYPDSPFILNQILEITVTSTKRSIYQWEEGAKVKFIFEHELRKCPHLFKPLPWHEDREPGDMPEYVKLATGVIVKVKMHFANGGRGFYYYSLIKAINRIKYESYEGNLPATLEDYNNYINSKA